jgi:hypothetical protein
MQMIFTMDTTMHTMGGCKVYFCIGDKFNYAIRSVRRLSFYFDIAVQKRSRKTL